MPDVEVRIRRKADSLGRMPLGFTGQQYDAESGLSYNRFDYAVSGVTRFDLDGVGRIRAAVPDSGSPNAAAGGGGERFGYSAAGVLTAAETSVAAVGGVASSPTAGPARVDRGSAVSSVGTLVTRVGRDRFSYDAAGRMVRRVRTRLSRRPEVTEFSYSDAGQIREVRVSDGSRWRYAYDGLGRRVGKRHTSADGRLVDEVVFGWDGDDLVLQTNTALTPRGQVPAGGSSTWVWTYHPDTGDVLSQQVDHATPHGPAPSDGSGATATPPVGEWSQSQVDTEFYAIVSDLAGAPTELVDPETGNVAGRARRTLWGATVWAGASTPLGFTGQQHDPESGLSYNRFRYYNPVTASYTSSDPLGVGPNPASATAYVHNPLTWIDPLGLMAHFKGKGTGQRKLWEITSEGTSAKKNGPFGPVWKSKSDGLWWSRDNAGHGESKWKVFRETSKGLKWRADADEFGTFIKGKHKSTTGEFIPWKQLT